VNQPTGPLSRLLLWPLTEFIFSYNTLEILGFAFDAVSNASVRLNREACNNSVDGPFAIVGAALRSLGLMMNVVVDRGACASQRSPPAR
jgi:hypothetical protein